MDNHHLMDSKKLLLNSYFYKTNHNGWLTRAIRFFISSPPRDGNTPLYFSPSEGCPLARAKEKCKHFNLPQKITKLAS